MLSSVAVPVTSVPFCETCMELMVELESIGWFRKRVIGESTGTLVAPLPGRCVLTEGRVLLPGLRW